MTNDKAALRRFGWWLLALCLACFAPLGEAQEYEDPPGRVARLGYFQGEVDFSPAGSEDWLFAQGNRPLTQGDRVWSAAGARAELSLGGSVLRMADRTRLGIVALDDRRTQLDLQQGSVALQVRALQEDENLEVDTPNLALVIREPGRYRVDVDGHSTQVTLFDGRATAYGEGEDFELYPGRSVRFFGTGLDRDEDVAPPDDGFDAWVAMRIRHFDDLESTRYVSTGMVGYESLDDYGEWERSSDYGAVWIPRVEVGWAPYRQGHWAWIAPWGWTWMDDAPWGFAPFHYGRWVQWRSRWCWVPGPVHPRPAYAPALVAFVGGAGWSLSVSSGPAVGWFPLGPGEVYRPAGRISRDYLVRVNPMYRGDFDRVRPHYMNERIHGAMTVVPRRDFAAGAPVAGVVERVEWKRFADAPMPNALPDVAPSGGALRGGHVLPGRPANLVPARPVLRRVDDGAQPFRPGHDRRRDALPGPVGSPPPRAVPDLPRGPDFGGERRGFPQAEPDRRDTYPQRDYRFQPQPQMQQPRRGDRNEEIPGRQPGRDAFPDGVRNMPDGRRDAPARSFQPLPSSEPGDTPLPPSGRDARDRAGSPRRDVPTTPAERMLNGGPDARDRGSFPRREAPATPAEQMLNGGREVQDRAGSRRAPMPSPGGELQRFGRPDAAPQPRPQPAEPVRREWGGGRSETPAQPAESRQRMPRPEPAPQFRPAPQPAQEFRPAPQPAAPQAPARTDSGRSIGGDRGDPDRGGRPDRPQRQIPDRNIPPNQQN